ncbi:MAG TPA: hypothetical protein VN541_11900, partial [Tepidisphaeraceae bacterium]|nr:hypothetical protein [Tepidisphaeraceae bacterium]
MQQEVVVTTLPPVPRESAARTQEHPIHEHETVIAPSRGWIGVNWAELFYSRELLYFLVWRDIKVRYKQ